MITMREATLAAIALAAKDGTQDTRILELHVHTAEVYALLAIADAIEKLAGKD